jgi:hypothetical protein
VFLTWATFAGKAILVYFGPAEAIFTVRFVFSLVSRLRVVVARSLSCYVTLARDDRCP